MRLVQALPWALGAVIWAALPVFLPRYMTDLLVFAGIYSIGGLGVGLLLGHCGIVNLAQSIFYAIGAYATAYCTVQLGAPSLVGFAVGAGFSMTLALVLGWPILRLTGYFLALATLALCIIGNLLFYEWDWLTGGSLGIGGIPSLEIAGYAFNTPSRFYYLTWLIAFLCSGLARNLVASRTGFMLRAMRDEADAAMSLAINLRWLRTRVFVLCALLGSTSGSLFAHYTTFVSVQSFGIDKTISFLLIPVLGGSTSLIGVPIGALFITVAPEFLSRLGDFHQVLFGMALVVVVLAAPNGLVGLFAGRWRRARVGPRDADAS